MTKRELPLKHCGVVYQIYPRSFRSANGRSTGDLQGITEKLDYLEWLGIQQIWLTPVYPSPMADGGYDVKDYRGIDPLFGSLSDFDELVDQGRRRGIGVIMDLVVNHTSDQHPWFQEALRDPKSPMRRRYIFRRAKADGSLPNNHLARFGGPAWEPVPGEPGMFYYHTFVSQQPELDYSDPSVMVEMRGIIDFWLRRGAAGLRVDAVHFIGKDSDMPDAPRKPDWDGQTPYFSQNQSMTVYQPRMYGLIKQFCEETAAHPGKFIVFETSPDEISEDIYHRLYRDAMVPGVGAPFNFALLLAEWTPAAVKGVIEGFLARLGDDDVAVWNLSNHDQHRLGSRIGVRQLRVGLTLLLTLPGVPTVYYGDELGLVDGPPAEHSDDPRQSEFSRDAARGPMAWNDDPATTGGFTRSGVVPWLPPGLDLAQANVQSEQADPDSLLKFVRGLIALRRSHPVLQNGRYEAVECDQADVLAYRLSHAHEQALVVLNFADEPCTVKLAVEGEIKLAANEARVKV